MKKTTFVVTQNEAEDLYASHESVLENAGLAHNISIMMMLRPFDMTPAERIRAGS